MDLFFTTPAGQRSEVSLLAKPSDPRSPLTATGHVNLDAKKAFHPALETATFSSSSSRSKRLQTLQGISLVWKLCALAVLQLRLPRLADGRLASIFVHE